jgi:hypothetical protein
MTLGVNNGTGQIKVKINGPNATNATWTSGADKIIPEEPGVLTLSADNTGAFEVFWRGENDAAAISMGTGNGNMSGATAYDTLYPLTFQHWVDIDPFDIGGVGDKGTVRVLDASALPTVSVLETLGAPITGLSPTEWVGFSADLTAVSLGNSVVLEFVFVSEARERMRKDRKVKALARRLEKMIAKP